MPQLDLGLVMGPQGPQGPEGPAGPQGPQGEQAKVVNDLTTGGADAALSAQMGVELEGKKSDVDLSNLPSPQMALVNLGAGVRPNLLDNPYFAGGGTGYGFFPVNQKGAASGNTDWLVMFDRWVQFGGQWSLTADGLSISTKPESLYWSFLQRSILDVSQLIGKTATVSVLMSDRLVSATSTLTEGMAIFPMLNGERIEVGCLSAEHTLSFQYYGADIPRTIRAVKLELGENQTLAMQDNSGTWVMLPQYDMDYGAQLLKCQKYSLVCDQPDTRYPGAINFSNGTVSVATPVQMAKLPVFTLREGVGYGVIYGPSGAIQVHSAAVSALGNNHVLLSITAETAGAFNCVYGECSFSLETGM